MEDKDPSALNVNTVWYQAIASKRFIQQVARVAVMFSPCMFIMVYLPVCLHQYFTKYLLCWEAERKTFFSLSPFSLKVGGTQRNSVFVLQNRRTLLRRRWGKWKACMNWGGSKHACHVLLVSVRTLPRLTSNIRCVLVGSPCPHRQGKTCLTR